MRKWTLFALVTGLALVVSSAWASTPPVVIDYLTGNIISGPGVIGGTPWIANGSGEWWDNNSSDPQQSVPSPHTKLNIGGVLVGGVTTTGSGFNPTKLANPPGVIPFLHDSVSGVGTAVTNWVFQDGPSVGVLRLEFAGHRGVNEFGIYKAGDPTTKKVLFTGSDSPVKTATFSPLADVGSTQFGLYMNYQNLTFYSESRFNSYTGTKPGWWDDATEKGYQHFALFKGAINPYGFVQWWIGVEDLGKGENLNERGGPGVGDYQDMVLTLEAIPDASTLALFLSGLPALALLRRRK
ncbi:MAG: hypothetical protein RMM06_03155 [Armatimonadota bacterium]|nr:hypothetical protein [Armatimonadota bacterium]